MQALKTLVIGLGIIIVFMMTVIGYGMYKKASDPNFRFFGIGAPSSEMSEAKTEIDGLSPFGDIRLNLPPSCQIADSRPGKGGQILLTIMGSTDGCSRLVVVDPLAGRVIGTIWAR